MAHNARHQRALDSRYISASVPKVMARDRDSLARIRQHGGLKNRCRFERKSWIPQVLISRTLNVCGEVAERLKAAVC